MFSYLASGYLTKRLARPISRAIPNPLLRTVAIAAAGWAIERMLSRRTARRSSGAPRAAHARGRR